MIPSFPQRRALALLAVAGCMAPLAWSQGSYPAQPIRIVNAFPPGGPSDIISRAVAEKMSAALKQTVRLGTHLSQGERFARIIKATGMKIE